MKSNKPVYVGVDLAKNSFDAAIATEDAKTCEWATLSHQHFEIAHDQAAAAHALAQWVKQETGQDEVALLVVESTGALSGRFAHLIKHWPVRIEDPCRIKRFAQSLGQPHKSDRVDAAMIALFASRRQPKPNTPRDEVEEKLRRLTRLRERYTHDRGSWKNRLGDACDPVQRRHIKQSMHEADRHIKSLDKEIEKTIASSERLNNQVRVMQQLSGIKSVVAPVLTAELGDLSAYSRNGLCAAAGVFPVARQSGQTEKRSHLAKTGSKRARTMLYLAARSLFRSKGPFRDMIERLEARGMPRAAITGVMMRKLLLVARAVVKSGGVYSPEKICFAQL